jgi:outer membrane receptor protein involved in Fe transport
MVSVGANMTGQSAILDDAGRSYPGGAVFGVDLRVRPVANLEFGIQGYNVFNRYDLRGSGSLAVPGSPAVIGTGPALGRTWTASVKYSF